MRIKFLKTGPYSLHPATGPVMDCVAGETTDIEEAYTHNIIRDGWAQHISLADHSIEQVYTSDSIYCQDATVHPWQRVDWNKDADDAKLKLEQYGKDVFGIDIDRRKSVTNIIKLLENAAKVSE